MKPNEWKQESLRGLIEYYIGGGWGKESIHPDFPCPAFVIRGTDIPSIAEGDTSTCPYRYHKTSNLNSRRLQENDIVFEVSGGSKDQPVGRSVILSNSLLRSFNDDVICASFCKLLRPSSHEILPLYLYYYLQDLYASRVITQWQVQSTGISNFKFEDFLDEHIIDLPTPDEQHKIASILSAYDGLIENNLRRIKILEEMAQNLYREWFVKFRFPGHEKVKFVDSPLGKIPEGWEVKTIKSICDIYSGFAFKSKTFIKEGAFQVVTIKHVKDGFFDSESDSYLNEPPARMKEYCYLHSGDILLSLTGNVGRSCLVYGDNYLLNQRVAKLVPKEGVGLGFIYSMFREPLLKTKLEMISTGVAQQNLSPIKMGKMEILIPTQALFKMFSDITDPICELIINYFYTNKILRQTRDLLLPRLISGELDVSDLDIEIPEDMK